MTKNDTNHSAATLGTRAVLELLGNPPEWAIWNTVRAARVSRPVRRGRNVFWTLAQVEELRAELTRRGIIADAGAPR